MPCDSGIPDYLAERTVAAGSRGREAGDVRVLHGRSGDPAALVADAAQERTLKAEPNVAHRSVAELERSGVPVRVITQNVDGLHQLAGMPARKVLELHGSARSVICTKCHARGPMEDAPARVEAGEEDPPCLECGGILKSATVIFGERLDPVVLPR
ncbi:hypothetical protein POF73_05365 [Streptomyces sp. HD]|nr:Sir2 family NAD-dependent protein deacetylase [Streptomyces sp. HD]MDC0766365.1 hypothetical protein [Streptomyces sp. HD]